MLARPAAGQERSDGHKVAKHSIGGGPEDKAAGPLADQFAQLELAAAEHVPVAPADLAGLSPRPNGAPGDEIDRLYAALAAATPESYPRTARLLASSMRKISQKVIEEAGEVALAAVKHDRRNIVRESADLIYHLVVLWRRAAMTPDDVRTEMSRRAASLGIAEKLPKAGADRQATRRR